MIQARHRDSLIVSRFQDFISHGRSYFVLQSVPRFISVEFIAIQKYRVSMCSCLSNYNRSIYRRILHIFSRMNEFLPFLVHSMPITMYQVENSLLIQVESINSINHGKKRYTSFDKKSRLLSVSYPTT